MSKNSKKEAVSTNASEAQSAAEPKVVAKIETLEKDKATLQTALDEKQIELDTAVEENEKLTEQVKTLESQVVDLKEDVQTFKSELEKAKNTDTEALPDNGKIKIASRSTDGFRRAGHKFTSTPETYDISDFTDDELKAIENEPNLVVVRA